MVPFTPCGLQTEDFRQYRTESALYPKTFEAYSTPTFTSDCGVGRFDNYHPQLLPTEGNYYGQSPTNCASYFMRTAPLIPLESSVQLCTMRGDVGAPHTSRCYGNAVQETNHQYSSKCGLVTASCSLYNFGAGYNQPTTTKNLVDLDYLSEALPSTTSPDSTASDSQVSNSTLFSEENLGNWLSAEQANVSREILTSPPRALQQHTRTGETRAEVRGTKLSSQKALTPSEKDLERRRKNNEASRKSRAQKKDRFLMDVLEVEHLRVENNRLRRFLAEVDSAIKEANDTLIAKFQYHLTGAPSPPL